MRALPGRVVPTHPVRVLMFTYTAACLIMLAQVVPYLGRCVRKASYAYELTLV